MKHAAFLALLMFCGVAQAQPAADKKIETVIVNGEKTTDSETHQFIQSHAAPAPFLGKLARWNRRNPICPNATGFAPNIASVIVRRIREVAGQIGTPVSQKPGCKPNMVIISTTVPRDLMAEIRATRSDLLGYFSSASVADKLAVIKHPIQALYETVTIDDNGNAVRDMMNNPLCPPPAESCPVASSGQRARDGMESAFYDVTIIVDAVRIGDHPLNALADYLAMMALSQTGDDTSCPDLPSITSLLSPDCPTAGLAETVSATDIAYLKGLYEMDAGAHTTIQRGTIAGEIRKSLEGR